MNLQNVYAFQDTPMYIPARQFLTYFDKYADHFELKRYIQFSTKVVKVEKSDDYSKTGRWIVTSQEIRERGMPIYTGKTVTVLSVME